MNLLLALSGRLRETTPSPPSRRPRLDHETLRRYVLEHLSQRITVVDHVAIACLSTSRFHEVFRHTMATSPHQFLLNTRLDQAAQLLPTTPLAVADISSWTGFSSPSALASTLRKHRGVTPSKLRSRA